MPELSGRPVYTRADLIAARGLSLSTLEQLWRDRANNGHPPAAGTIGRALAWDAETWDTWYDHLTTTPTPAGETLQQLAARVRRSVRTLEGLWYRRAVNGHPDRIPPAQDDPPNSPPRWDPDTYLSWFADRHGVHQVEEIEPSRTGVGRPRGSGATRHPYQDDPRLDQARAAIRATPTRSNAAVARDLAGVHTDTTGRVWLRIVSTARQHPGQP